MKFHLPVLLDPLLTTPTHHQFLDRLRRILQSWIAFHQLPRSRTRSLHPLPQSVYRNMAVELFVLTPFHYWIRWLNHYLLYYCWKLEVHWNLTWESRFEQVRLPVGLIAPFFPLPIFPCFIVLQSACFYMFDTLDPDPDLSID